MPSTKPAHPRAHASGIWEHPVPLHAATALLLALGWVGFVGSLHWHEMFLGAVVVALATAFCALIYRSETLPLSFRMHDLVQCWRVPWYMLTKCTEITWLLFRDLAGQRAASLYRVCGFSCGSHDPDVIGRTVLAIAYTTVAPNFIVIGIDPHQNHMLFHQIRRGSVSTMTQELGAQR